MWLLNLKNQKDVILKKNYFNYINKKNNKTLAVINNQELRNFGGISDIINQSRIQNDLVEYVQDQYIRYTNYKNFDYLSLLFISAHGRHIHFQIVFNENYVFFITSEYDSDSTKIIKDIKKNVNKIIANVEINNEIIGRIFLLILDIIIQHYSLILEMVEDNIEIIQEKLNSTKQIQSFTKKIQDTKKIVYSLKKNIRAFASLPPEIELNANEYILGRNRYVLQTIKHRINNLVKFSESVYSFVEELIRQYDSKINNQTNILVMRLTSWTIIFSIWMVVAGIYGMNFDLMPELGWEYSYFIVIGLLIIATIVAIIIFRKKGWL